MSISKVPYLFPREQFANRRVGDYYQKQHFMDKEKPHRLKSNDDWEMSASYTKDSCGRRSKRKCQNEFQPSEEIDYADQRHKRFHSSTFERESRDKRQHYHLEKSKPEFEGIPIRSERHNEERYRHCYRHSEKHRGREDRSHSRSSYETSISRKHQRGREIESSNFSKHSRHGLKSPNKEWNGERKKFASGSDKDKENYQHYKRRKVH